mgnify:CR=1 FL=1
MSRETPGFYVGAPFYDAWARVPDRQNFPASPPYARRSTGTIFRFVF